MDLFRIKGVGPQYAELLEAAGVDTVIELSERVPENLMQKMVATNTEHKKVHQLPTLAQVKGGLSKPSNCPGQSITSSCLDQVEPRGVSGAPRSCIYCMYRVT